MAAGTVYLYTYNDNYNTNLYYINNITTIDPKCLYYILRNI
jgi:hypothetical protein